MLRINPLLIGDPPGSTERVSLLYSLSSLICLISHIHRTARLQETTRQCDVDIVFTTGFMSCDNVMTGLIDRKCTCRGLFLREDDAGHSAGERSPGKEDDENRSALDL
jgi:hypothetical protein